MLRCVDLVRTDVLEEHITLIIRMSRISKYLLILLWLLVTANVPSLPILVIMMMEAIVSSEMSVLTRVTWHNIPKDDILYSHHCENLKSYRVTFVFVLIMTRSAPSFSDPARL
jgi:hypothetical protein